MRYSEFKEIISEGEYQTVDQVQAAKGSYTRLWVPRIANLKLRCEQILKQVAQAAPNPVQRMPRIDVDLHDTYAALSPMKASGYTPILKIDVTVFWDAPDETLTFVIAHELGHLVLDHDPGNDGAPARNEELAADAYAGKIMQKLGLNQARVFRFMHSKQSDYEQQERANRKPTSTHPTYQQRQQQMRDMGLKITHGGAEQLAHLMA
jgi:predicted SnoaL-like aldol condensation-catalyzing enzyme